jgi:FMN reductase
VSDIVIVSGHPRSGSRTKQLAAEVGRRFAERGGQQPPVVVDVAELGGGVLLPGDAGTEVALEAVQDASVLIVASPTLRGTYSGMLKIFFERLPANALAGIVAVPVVTASSQEQADLTESFLARLLSTLGAEVVDFGLTATGPELQDLSAVAGQYAAEIAALTRPLRLDRKLRRAWLAAANGAAVGGIGVAGPPPTYRLRNS